jgi:hypothetical protein
VNSRLNPHRTGSAYLSHHGHRSLDPAPPSKPQITLHIIIKKPKISEKSLAASAAIDDMNLSFDLSLTIFPTGLYPPLSSSTTHSSIPLLFREKKKDINVLYKSSIILPFPSAIHSLPL